MRFVRDHRDALAATPTAFFQASLSPATPSGPEQAAGYVDTFIEETGWHPDRIGLVGGALRYGEYGFLMRWFIKRIASRQLPEAPSEDVAFADRNEVKAFGADGAAFAEGRLGIVPPAATTSD